MRRGVVFLFNEYFSKGQGKWLEMAEGKTLMVLGTEKEILSIIAVADEMRESSKEVINKLNRMGFKTVMLTGDDQRTASV